MSDITPKKKIVRTLRGVVISTTMDQTAVVAVNSMKSHPKYRQSFRSTTKYKVHDAHNEAKVGQEVSFMATRPMSRGKRWVLAPVSGAEKKSKKHV